MLYNTYLLRLDGQAWVFHFNACLSLGCFNKGPPTRWFINNRNLFLNCFGSSKSVQGQCGWSLPGLRFSYSLMIGYKAFLSGIFHSSWWLLTLRRNHRAVPGGPVVRKSASSAGGKNLIPGGGIKIQICYMVQPKKKKKPQSIQKKNGILASENTF